MYQAFITKVELAKHPNADRLQIGRVLGEQVVTGLETQEGFVIYFPENGQLSNEYCVANDLYPRFDETGERVGGGYIDPKSRRVQAQNFRGEKSYGLIMPLSSLGYTGVSLSVIESDATKAERNGQTYVLPEVLNICTKYIKRYASGRVMGGTQRKITDDTLGGLFPRLPDTDNLYHTRPEWLPNLPVIVTEKLHGTCLVADTTIRMWDGSSKRIRDIGVGEIVLGMADDMPVPSTVTDAWNHGRSNDWLNVAFDRGFSRGRNGGNSFGRIRCTPEHLFMTRRGYIEAKDLAQDDELVVVRRDHELSWHQQQILLGMLLGDGSLSRNAKYSCGVAFSHKVDHEEYMMHIVKSLGSLCTGSVNYATSGYGTPMIRAITLYTPHITNMFSSMYDGKKRVVPEWVADALSPLSLAYWYMDDGSLTHTTKQRDRANIATCAYSEEDCKVLVRGLSRFGMDNVTLYNDTSGYWRIRINADSADILFRLIAPHMPEVMRYKLPEEYRNAPYWQGDYDDSQQSFFVGYGKVTSVTPYAGRGNKNKYDLTTTTGNFVAHNAVVHNSQRLARVPKQYTGLLGKLRKLWDKWRGNDMTQFVVGTRRTIVESTSEGYYGSEKWRIDAAAPFVPHIKLGEIIYGELVGFLSDGRSIMPSHDPAKVTANAEFKKLAKGYRNPIVYDYGNSEGCTMYVYRIDYDSRTLTYDEMVARCVELSALAGAKLSVVPLLWRVTWHLEPGMTNNDLVLWAKQVAEGDSVLGKHPREGVVFRYDTPTGLKVYKAKSHSFLVMEGVANEEVVNMEDAS